MSDSVGRIDLDLEVNKSGFNKDINRIASNAERSVGSAFKGLGKTIASAFAIKKVFDFGRAAIGLGSDLMEVQNVVDVTFGSMAEDINQFSKNALESFGLSELSAKKFTSTMGAMLKSSGLAGKSVLDMSKGLTGLAGDFASFYNLDPEEAFSKIRSGISGETEPLKQLGINLSVANMEAFALSQGIRKSYGAMSQAEQTLLRYNYLLSVSKDAQGDFARTSGSWANQTRILREQFKSFMATMGQGFINILGPVIRLLNSLIQKLQVAAQYFKAFTELITGVKRPANTATTATVSVGDAASGMGSGLKKANKEIKGSLSSFDQLNVISQSAADSLGDVGDNANVGGVDLGSVSGPSGEIAPIDMSAMEPMVRLLDSIKTSASNVGKALSDAFGPSFKSVLASITPELAGWKTTLQTTFSEFGLLGEPIKAWLVNDLVPFWQREFVLMGQIVGDALGTARIRFEDLKTVAMPILQWFVTDGLPLMTDFSNGMLTIFESIYNNTKSISDTLWSGAVKPGLDILSEMTLGALDGIKGFWNTWGDDIVLGVTTAIDNIKEIFDTLWDSFLGPVITDMLNTFRDLWNNHFKDLFTEVLNFIGKLVTGALDIYNKFIAPIVNWLIETFGPIFASTFDAITDIIETVVGTVADVAKDILKALGGIIDFIVGIFTGDWEKAWNGIKDFFSGLWDGIKDVFKGVINLIIDGLNLFIRGLNMLSFDIPDWIPVIGGKKFGMNIPEIPKLAHGGLVSGPTLAMVGDNSGARSDPEVISPLSKLQEILGGSNQLVVEVLLRILDAIENQDNSIELDGEKVGRKLRKYMMAEGNRVGKRAVLIGGEYV